MTIDYLDKFFVSGMGRSGSTWLQMLLNSHPEIVCLGEGQLFQNMPQKLKDLIDRHNEIQEFLLTTNFGDSQIPAYPRLDENDLVEILRFTAGRVFEKFPVSSQTKAIGDKSPQNWKSIALIRRTFPDSKFIHIIRDPRDVLVSSWHQWKRTKPQELQQLYRNDIVDLAKSLFEHWRLINDTALAFQNHHPDVLLITTYESLTSRPEQELVGIFAFLGVSERNAIVTECIERNRFELLSGGRERGEADNSAFFRKGEVSAWQKELPEGALAQLSSEVKLLMQRLGYES